MRTTRTQRMLMKLFPATTDRIWTEGFTMGKETGTKNEQSKVAQRLRANHVKDFGKASLTLGYEQAAKAARGELDDVA